MDTQPLQAHCAYCYYAQRHNLPLCEEAGRTSQDLDRGASTLSRHDTFRDTLSNDWQTALIARREPVLPIKCECGNSIEMPLDGVKVVTEYTWRGKRTDIAILDVANKPCCFGEVIDKGPPSPDKLAIYRQAGFPIWFIPYADTRALFGYCSVTCWENRQAVMQRVESNINNLNDEVGIDSLRWCEDCGVKLERNEAIIDCQGVLCPKCVGPNVIYLCCWGKHNNFDDDYCACNGGGFVCEHSTLAQLLAYWNTTDFWRFVWEKRVREPSEPYGDPKNESLTISALQFVDTAIASNEFRIAYYQLLDIGRNPMTAFEARNCQAVARCWTKLELHAESLLPSDFEVLHRPDEWER